MKTLLIVEDEKLIRQGIAVMAGRCRVEIGEIIECRNGLEAMDILKSREIDVMFTDIRMPKMDGIELVKETETLEKRPKIVVISGYDDFNYAVEMLKSGVQDYILKPVKREKIEEILQKLDAQLGQERKIQGIEMQTFLRQFKLYLMNPEAAGKEWEDVRWRFEQYMGQTPYYCVAAGADFAEMAQESDGGLCIEEEGQCIAFLKCINPLWNQCLGVSGEHTSFLECASAYHEAMQTRIHAYFCGAPVCIWKENKGEEQSVTRRVGLWGEEGEPVPEDFVNQFVRQFSTEHFDGAVKMYQNLFFKAAHGQIKEYSMVETACKLEKGLADAYKKLVPEEKKQIFDRNHPLAFRNAKEYMESFLLWISQLRSCLDEEYDSNQSRSRIRSAVEYLEENYKKNLNMAMVSNHVSMNYSLFSIAFKEYTGVNFVSYLKNLRIQEAMRLLENTEDKIQEIGRAVGFENDKHFLKAFKTETGISPTEYRNHARRMADDKI